MGRHNDEYWERISARWGETTGWTDHGSSKNTKSGRTLSARPAFSNAPKTEKLMEKPVMQVEMSVVFSEEQIKQILADYVKTHYDLDATTKNITGDFRAASYSQFDNSPAYCKFTVKVQK